MEDCWRKDKHGKLEDAPLECLSCKRMNMKIMEKPENAQLAAFLDGYRLAILEITVYVQPFTKEQKDMIQGLEIRFKCAIDRGIELEQLKIPLEHLDPNRKR